MAYLVLVEKKRDVRADVPASPQGHTPSDLISSLLDPPSTDTRDCGASLSCNTDPQVDYLPGRTHFVLSLDQGRLVVKWKKASSAKSFTF